MKFLFLFLTSTLAHAQFTNPSNVPTAVGNAVVGVLQTMKRSDVSQDSISGICSYREASCNGAQIFLSQGNKQIFQATLTSINSFKIPGLKANETYTLKVVWDKFNLKQEKMVQAGEYIQINLTDKKAK